MAEVGIPRLGSRVVVDVDDVIEHPHGRADGLLELNEVQTLLVYMERQTNRSEVADRGFLSGGIEQDLGAEVGAVDDSLVVLRGAKIGGVLEGDPWVTCLEDHGEDLAPEGSGLNALEESDLSPVGHRLVLAVTLLKSATVEVVKVFHIAWAEKGPLSILLDPLHEKVGDPVGGVHVVGAASLVAHVLAKLEEVLDVEMPGLEVGAHRTLALATLVDGDSGVIGHLEEGDDALALAIGPLDERPGGTDVGPVVAEAARPLRELGVVADALEDVVEVVHDRRQIAGAELRVQGATVEEGRCGRGEEEAGEQLVELDGALVFLRPLVHGEAQADAHPEELGRLDAAPTDVDEVAVVNGLQAHVVEEQVTLGLEGGGDLLEVEFQKRRGQATCGDPLLEVGLEAGGMGHRDIVVVFEPG